jgi:hypothetical protein
VSRRRPHGIVEGALVVVGLAMVPVALAKALQTPVAPRLASLVELLVAIAGVAWLLVVANLVRMVHSALHLGESAVEPGPIGWAAVRVASLVLLVAPFLDLASGTVGRPAGGTRDTRPVAMAPQSWLDATYVVQPGDTLSSIAQLLYGDADRWPQLAARNLGRTMPDGRRLDDAGTLRPGWTLLFDADDTRVDGGGDRGDPRSVPIPRARRRGGHRGQGRVTPPISPGALLVPLAAELRRRRRTTSRVVLDDDTAIDEETTLLAARPVAIATLTSIVRALAGARRLDAPQVVVLGDGEATLLDGSWRFDPQAPRVHVRALVVPLGEARDGTHLAVVPSGAELCLAGSGASELFDDAIRVAPALELGRPVRATPSSLLESLAQREDGELVVCVGAPEAATQHLAARTAVVRTDGAVPLAVVDADTVTMRDGTVLRREVLSPLVRRLLEGDCDRPMAPFIEGPEIHGGALGMSSLRDDGVVVRLLTAVPRVDGLAESLEPGRERRAIELVAYLSLRPGAPVTGERLRVRVLGRPSSDAASKTLFNVASTLRRSLGDGPLGPRLPPAGKVGRYAVTKDVACDVRLLEGRVARAQRCEVIEERIAWLRAALELIEEEPFATVLEGYDWFVTEGHLARLQTVCEDAACELVELALRCGLVPLARFALDRARLVDPYAERLADAASRVEAARQASLAAMAPAPRSTVPSAPTLT